MIEDTNSRFDEAIDAVRDPGRHERQMKAMREDPLMAAGIRGLDRLKWNLKAGIDPFSS